MRNLTSLQIEKSLIACALIASLAACDNSVTEPIVTDPIVTEPSGDPVTQPRTLVQLTTADAPTVAGEIMWVMLEIPAGRGAEGAYQVVLSWDDLRFEYQDFDNAGSTARPSQVEHNQATFELWVDNPSRGRNRLRVAFVALQDGPSSGFRILSTTSMR